MEPYKKCKICGGGIAMNEKNTGNGFNIESRNAAGETYYLSLSIRKLLFLPDDASNEDLLRNEGFAHYDCIMDAIVEFRELAKKIGGHRRWKENGYLVALHMRIDTITMNLA